MLPPDYPNGIYTAHIGDNKDLSTDEYGRINRDYTISSRCSFRLTCRRGEWVYDPDCGSRFHTIKTLLEGKRKAKFFAQEALQPIIDEGLIKSVDTGKIFEHPLSGALLVPIIIQRLDNSPLPLGDFRLGG